MFLCCTFLSRACALNLLHAFFYSCWYFILIHSVTNQLNLLFKIYFSPVKGFIFKLYVVSVWNVVTLTECFKICQCDSNSAMWLQCHMFTKALLIQHLPLLLLQLQQQQQQQQQIRQASFSVCSNSQYQSKDKGDGVSYTSETKTAYQLSSSP